MRQPSLEDLRRICNEQPLVGLGRRRGERRTHQEPGDHKQRQPDANSCENRPTEHSRRHVIETGDAQWRDRIAAPN